MKRLTLSSLFSLVVLASSGNGVAFAGGSSSQIAVAITGASQVTPGTPIQFTASIAGTSNTAVTWSIIGTSASENYGTISASGIYTPPATVPVHNQIKIVATSQADPTRSSATATTIMNPVPSIAAVSFTAGYHSTFLVDVKGSNFTSASQVVYLGYGWTTTYVSASELTFAMTSPPAAGTLVSLSVVTPSPGRTQSAAYSAAVPATVAVSVTGASQAFVTAPVQYTASVTGTANTAVTWSIKGTSTAENYGTISTSGLYTPPANVPAHGIITITATSQADTTKSGAASVTIANPTPAISSATLAVQPSGNYLVTINGSNFMPASGAVPGPYGVPTTYVSPTKLQFTLTFPPAAGTVIPLKVVTPAPGEIGSATYSMVIPAGVGITVSGASVATIGTPVQYSAAVTNTSNSAVNWSIKGTLATESYGTISSTGLYTPPTAVPVHGLITITATSQADMTKSYAASVTITNPTPAITSAALTLQQNGSYLVDVKGSNFMPASGAAPGGYGVPTTYVSPNELKFTWTKPPAPGTPIALTVVTPAPGEVKSAVYNLEVTGTVGISVSGASVATIGTPVQYTAAVTGTSNTAVTWAIKGTLATESYGTISASGLYTPPAGVPVHGLIAITATSTADLTKTASTSVTIANPTAAISAVTLTTEPHSTFLVDVLGTNIMPASVIFYAGYGQPTTYAGPGHLQFTLTSPPAAGTVETFAVVTPAPGRTQSANFNATIPGLVGVTAVGATQATVSTPAQYTATVTGTSNTAVTWKITGASASENYGTISASGLYSPPATVPAHSAITITATSVVDPTKYSPVAVSLENAVPSIASAVATAASGGGVVFDVKGSNYVPSSQVIYSGYGLATSFVSANELTATMPSWTVTGLTAGSDITISVLTPNPGKEQSGSYSVQLPGAVGIKIAGRGMVGPGETSQYIATVTGTQNMAVTWSVGGAGTISATGLYTPPASISANATTTVTATSQAEPGSSSSTTISLVTVPAAAAVRLLEESTFGPTESAIEHVQTIGLSNYINEQLTLSPTLLPAVAAQPFCGNSSVICNDENWWNNAVTAPDQLRQRVSNALSEILVVSYREVDPTLVPPYINMLTTDAFGNWSTIMKDTTLSPAMGTFLNMVNSGKPAAGAIANENFARENMQLFNLGINLLNQDGTLQTDSSGNPIPAYTEAQVEAFSRVFTGWTWALSNGTTPAAFPNWTGYAFSPMVAVESAHDTSAKVLLNTTLPAGQTAEQDLAAAIQDVFNHQNVAPFVSAQLIEHLVKSNPSPAYIGRVAAVFVNDGTGVRGNMSAVIKAILLDPEARAGDIAAVANDGYLREPMLWTASVLRGLNAAPKPGVTDNSAYTSIDSFTSALEQKVFNPSTVFNFYPADYGLEGTSLNAPQFALETSATIMQKLTLASAAVDNELGRLAVDLTDTSPLATLAAASDGLMLDALSRVFLHNTMSAQMRTTIESAISGVTDPAQRVRMATYLVITSSQYKVIH